MLVIRFSPTYSTFHSLLIKAACTAYGADSWLADQSQASSTKGEADEQLKSKIVCDNWQSAWICDGSGKVCVLDSITCTSWHYEQWGLGGGGSGSGDSGGGSGGSFPDPCTPCDPTMPCDDTGGLPTGCHVDPPPPPDDPCEFANPPEYCSQDPCETNGEHPALDDDAVQQAMDEAWLASYGSEDNPLPDDQRKEAMFMVLATSDGYKIEEIPAGSETSSCHFESNDVSIPSNIAALIHTHPYSDGDTVNDPRCDSGIYDGDEPSSADKNIVQQISSSDKLPSISMYVIDKDNIRIIKPSNPSQYGETINRCGY